MSSSLGIGELYFFRDSDLSSDASTALTVVGKALARDKGRSHILSCLQRTVQDIELRDLSHQQYIHLLSLLISE